MNRIWLGVSVGLVMAVSFLGSPAWAEMYEWVDDQGVTHISTDPPPGWNASVAPPAPVLRRQVVTTVQPAAPVPANIVVPQVRRDPPPVTAPVVPAPAVQKVAPVAIPPSQVHTEPPAHPAPVLGPPTNLERVVDSLVQQVQPTPSGPPVPVTAQVSTSTRTIQVLNGSKLIESQQIVTTSVVVPHSLQEPNATAVQDMFEREWDQNGSRQLY